MRAKKNKKKLKNCIKMKRNKFYNKKNRRKK